MTRFEPGASRQASTPPELEDLLSTLDRVISDRPRVGRMEGMRLRERIIAVRPDEAERRVIMAALTVPPSEPLHIWRTLTTLEDKPIRTAPKYQGLANEIQSKLRLVSDSTSIRGVVDTITALEPDRNEVAALSAALKRSDPYGSLLRAIERIEDARSEESSAAKYTTDPAPTVPRSKRTRPAPDAEPIAEPIAEPVKPEEPTGARAPSTAPRPSINFLYHHDRDRVVLQLFAKVGREVFEGAQFAGEIQPSIFPESGALTVQVSDPTAPDSTFSMTLKLEKLGQQTLPVRNRTEPKTIYKLTASLGERSEELILWADGRFGGDVPNQLLRLGTSP